jgi:hypothetical protein
VNPVQVLAAHEIGIERRKLLFAQITQNLEIGISVVSQRGRPIVSCSETSKSDQTSSQRPDVADLAA